MVPRIRQVRIRNYKSIDEAVVDLEPFTALVGPNGAGKSNFIDALAFVQACLSESIELAFKNRGGIGAVRRRSWGRPTHIGIRLNVDLGDNRCADYEFILADKPRERFRVAREWCAVQPMLGEPRSFEVCDGKFVKGIAGLRPRTSADRLALSAASETEEFGPVYDFLTSMRFYSIVPERLRELQEPDPGDFLKRDGSNAAAVLKRLRDEEQGTERYKLFCQLLSKVVEGVGRVEYKAAGRKETLQFKQDVGQKHPWTFEALNMSDGTLRVLGVLLAIVQAGVAPVVAIEEPEAMVHPAAAELLVQVLLDAAAEKQILITTHSPDILGHPAISDAQVRVVAMERGATLIAPVSESTRQAMRRHLYSPGQLLRADELKADLESTALKSQQMDLFADRTQEDPERQ